MPDTSNKTYVGAPYNFIPFSDTVISYPEEKIPAHDKVSDELLSGEISYTMIAKTPIFVGAGNVGNERKVEDFYKDIYGNYAIPGSTVRGLIRNNAQVLSLSGFGDDIDDYSLMFRQVGGRSKTDIKKQYETILGANQIVINDGKEKHRVSILKNVRAGYITNENGKYKIYDTVIDQIDRRFNMMNYYVLSERMIANDYAQSKYTDKFSYKFLFNNNHNLLQYDISRGFQKRGKRFVGTKNQDYHPFYKRCSYEVKNRTITAVGRPGEYSQSGYVVGTGFMNDKKAIYIIPMVKEEECDRFDGIAMPISIPEKDIKAFQIDFKKRENSLKEEKDLFSLPQPGEMRPVFYIYLDGKLYFGFTPRLRLFYNHTIKDGLYDSHKSAKLDYAKAIFGYSNQENSYKSRVSFTDARLQDGVSTCSPEDAILAEPKPTSYLDYVKDGLNYNNKDFQIRGIKQYWLRSNAKVVIADNKRKEKYVSHFAPLPVGCEFGGKIRFHNLKREELGLLLWSTQLEKNSMLNVGKAKAYGFGCVSVGINEVKVLDSTKAYDMNAFSIDVFKTLEAFELIGEYKSVLKEYLNGKNPENNESIKALLAMKDSAHMPDPETIRYMSIDDSEYQSRTEALQKIEDLVKIEKPEKQVGESYSAKFKRLKSGGKIILARIDDLSVDVELPLSAVTCEVLTNKTSKTRFNKNTKLQLVSRDNNEWECVKILDS